MKANCIATFSLFIVFITLFISTSAEAQSTTIPPSADSIAIDSRVFEKVEVEASVSVVEWRSHLQTHLLPYIEKAANKKIKAGNYTINVRFLVERDGSITDVKALNDPGFGLAKGAEKVVKTGPRWTPGEINGKKVRSYHMQPITFSIVEQ